ncbi:MAG: FAD-dependent oxidoreductase, partial [Chloroflexi bacterium]|nr:FAD-dependent oxidoreductase [Chloroflexota bacterium]
MLERDQIKSDILVIGAGPAGLVASTVAAQAGANVLLVDENSWAGGRLALQTQPLQGPRSVFNDASGVEFCQQLLEDAVSAGVELMLNTTVSELSNVATDEHRWVASLNVASEGQRGVSARAVVLATGSREPWLEFPGSDLQGVMLSGDAQEMLNVRGALPGRRVLMVGSDNAGLLIAANLRDAGAQIVA